MDSAVLLNTPYESNPSSTYWYFVSSRGLTKDIGIWEPDWLMGMPSLITLAWHHLEDLAVLKIIVLQTGSASVWVGLAIVTFAGVSYGVFSPAFNLATNVSHLHSNSQCSVRQSKNDWNLSLTDAMRHCSSASCIAAAVPLNPFMTSDWSEQTIELFTCTRFLLNSLWSSAL